MTQRQDALLDLIYGAIADPGRWPEIITRVSDHLGAIGGMVMHIPAVGNGHVIATYGRLSADYAAVVHNHYAWNPWAVAMKGVPVDQAVVANSHLQPGQLFKTGFYADVLKPQGIMNAISSKHHAFTSDGGTGGFGFMLSVRGAEQADSNARRLQRLLPHLNRALDGTLQLGRFADGGQQLTSMLQLMPNAALLINTRGRVTFANAAAEMLLRTGDGLSIDSNGSLQLAAAFPAESAMLAKTLAHALAVAAGTGNVLSEPLRLTRPSGAPPLLVLPVPLPPLAFELWTMLEPARVLLLVIDPAAQWRSKTSTIQASFGLTLAEARVAVLVGSGLTAPQAAEALGISLSTVKTHLKRCFDKIGVHSQVALARLLATLPIDPAGG